MAESLRLRSATARDAGAVAALVNNAYRGEGGARGAWTTEADIVEGPRITEEGFLALLHRPGGVVLLAERGGRLVGCVHLERRPGGVCHLGLLSVHASAQSGGVGRALLAHAEAHARDVLGAERMVMRVLTVRPELLAWYERRGYRRTGDRVPFHPPDEVRSLRGPLEFERLEKRLAGEGPP